VLVGFKNNINGLFCMAALCQQSEVKLPIAELFVNTQELVEFVGTDVAVVLSVVEEVREDALPAAVAQRVAFRTRPVGCRIHRINRRTAVANTDHTHTPV